MLMFYVVIVIKRYNFPMAQMVSINKISHFGLWRLRILETCMYRELVQRMLGYCWPRSDLVGDSALNC